jgi:hypothetical protein
MRTRIALLCLPGLFGFWAVGSSASAFTVAPECMKMKDKLGCTCAVQNGGGINYKPGATRPSWYSKRDGRDPTNEAFVKCQIRNGRRG